LHQPKIIFLDEPTSGVDPLTRRQFWDIIRIFAAQGITIFVTTHYLDEAEQSTSIGLIHKGRLIAKGTVDDLKTRYMTNPLYEIACSNPIDALELLQQIDTVIETSIFGMNIHIVTRKEAGVPEGIRESLQSAGITVHSILPITPSLEDVFIHLIEGQFKVSEL
jgi:ABC-2 type transport system ATP-binding protein